MAQGKGMRFQFSVWHRQGEGLRAFTRLVSATLSRQLLAKRKPRPATGNMKFLHTFWPLNTHADKGQREIQNYKQEGPRDKGAGQGREHIRAEAYSGKSPWQ